MVGREFLDRIQKHATLHLGRGPRDDRIYIVFCGPDRCRVGWEVDPTTIVEHPWPILEEVLTGRRRPEVMSHITRIVGYYSHLHGWNRSKLAELKGRHAGDYVIPGDLADDYNGETPASKRAHRKAILV